MAVFVLDYERLAHEDIVALMTVSSLQCFESYMSLAYFDKSCMVQTLMADKIMTRLEISVHLPLTLAGGTSTCDRVGGLICYNI